MATSTTNMKPHAGEAFLSFASQYPSLLRVISEAVQNAIDSSPTTIHVDINMNTRSVIVRDDGAGVSKETFDEVLGQVGKSIKGSDKLGKFGRGSIAALGKCVKFTFCSCPKQGASQGYYQWTFVTNDIANMRDNVRIPVRHLSNWQFCRTGKQDKNGKKFASFRTELAIHDITSDRFISAVTMNSMCEELIEAYGPVIRKRNIGIFVHFTDANGRYEECKVEPPAFMGQKLKDITYTEPDVGEVCFSMYVTPLAMNGRKGRILLGEMGDEFRLSVSQFIQSAPLLDDDVVKVLRSGVFEGEILGKNVKLHVNRKQFEQNDALVGMCICINQWFADVGYKYYNEVLSQNRGRRYQKLGLRAMKVVEKFLQRPEMAKLIKSFTLGSIGDGHTEKPPVGTDKATTLSTQGGGPDKKKGQSGGERQAGGERGEKQNHMPTTVAGPDGENRTLVRSNSTGLQLSIEELPGKSTIYVLDRSRGILRINARHPHFAECEETDTALMRYIETVSALALTLALYEGTESYEHREEALHQALELLVLEISSGDRLSGRRASGGKSTEN